MKNKNLHSEMSLTNLMSNDECLKRSWDDNYFSKKIMAACMIK